MLAGPTALWGRLATRIPRRRAGAKARRSTRASDTTRMMAVRGGKRYHLLLL